jgi:hypothetical protein
MMSATLEAPATSEASANNASTRPSEPTPTPGVPVEIEATGVTIDITFSFNTTTNLWDAHSTHQHIVVGEGELYQLTWNLISPTAELTDTVFFLNSGIVFPAGQKAAPMVVIQNPTINNKQIVALWSNASLAFRGTYAYNLDAKIDGQTVIHDPTVENDPPTT